MMTEQARRPLAIVTATARPDLLSQGSHVAPSPQRRIPCKRHETELIYCPIYGFKPPVLATRGLTPALFCGPTAHPPLTLPPLPSHDNRSAVAFRALQAPPHLSSQLPSLCGGACVAVQAAQGGSRPRGGRGAARPTPRSRPRRRAGSLWEYGSPPVGARLKVCQHRPRAKFSPKMAAQLQVKHYREKLQDLGGV